MNITDKEYKKWLKLSRVITGCDNYAEEVLHEVLLKLIENNIEGQRINDNYIFISLRNTYFIMLKKESKARDYKTDFKFIYEEEDTNQNMSKEDLMEFSRKDFEVQNKLYSIEDVILNLPEFEQKLYSLHFLFNISQRRISRESGLGMGTINSRINKIKLKINQEYEKRNPKE